MFNAEAFLIEHQVQPFLNRVMILDYLYHHEHPSADEIYQDVKEKNATLSKMTVYNVINLFKEKGIIRDVTINDKDTRYDIITKDHGHFKCTSCGQIYDFDLNMEEIRPELPDGFSVQKKDVFVYGICSQCQTKENNA